MRTRLAALPCAAVVLDYHPSYGGPGTAEEHSRSPAALVAGWRRVWRTLACLPSFGSDIKGRVFIDILNEPDCLGYRYAAVGTELRTCCGALLPSQAPAA
jgi:hypothetical protein